MSKDESAKLEAAAARQRRIEMQHLQWIEGNPLTAAEIAMFEMFEREGWSGEEQRAYILALAKGARPPQDTD